MANITRRDFMKFAGGLSAAGAIGFPYVSWGAAKKVVVVGGGIGGATAAKYLRMMDAGIEVTLIEPKQHYYTCFMSNEVLGGERNIEANKFGYDGLTAHGVKVVHDMVTAIDPAAQKVVTKGGQSFAYDRCIVSPGIDFRWDAIKGYDAQVAETIPHAYKAGPQTVTLRKQLEAMPDGGTFLISVPANPYRCPPGPYERICQVAHYFKQHKPKSKILVLDAKDKFSKFDLFMAGWKKYYGYGSGNSMIEWVNDSNGGRVEALDAKTKTVTAAVHDFKGDVLNIIPPQKANKIAFDADLVDGSGWCPVHPRTFESTKHKNIHVIGDASIAVPLPKSGYAANSEAKVCAASVVASLNGMEAPEPSWVNTCYSLITPEDAISVAMVYRLGEDGKIHKVKGAGGVTPMDSPENMRRRSVDYAHSWFNNITHDIFG